jgi:release factor glutamine methyltransferase
MFAENIMRKNSKNVFSELIARISIHEDVDEIGSIIYIILSHLFGVSKTDVIAEKQIEVSKDDELKINDFVARLNSGEPIQYILGEEEFFGRKFIVNNSVLIPRPETEELVNLVKEFAFEQKRSLKILDIGTGSGCIPITLSLEIPDSKIWATDISEHALKTAGENAERLNASVTFMKHDILAEDFRDTNFDVVVSNPPYIAEEEKVRMKMNVVNYEPHLALFVSDSDPLIFYRAIASKAVRILQTNGLLAVEINERFGQEVRKIFVDVGLKNVRVRQDISGKDRIVAGFR